MSSLSVANVTKTGSGTWTLSSSNSFTGGTLNTTHPNALGTGTSNAVLNLASDGADFTNALAADSGVTFGVPSDVKTGSAGINHSLGSFTLGSSAPAMQMNVTRGANVSSGNPRSSARLATLACAPLRGIGKEIYRSNVTRPP